MTSTVRTLNRLTFREVVTVPAYSVKREDFVNGNLGWKLYKGRGFKEIEAELKHETISCPTHSREVFKLRRSMYDEDIEEELNQTSYPTIEEVIASFISRINMWIGDKNSKHGLHLDGRNNIEYAIMSCGLVASVVCRYGVFWGGRQWYFGRGLICENGRWNPGPHLSCPYEPAA